MTEHYYDPEFDRCIYCDCRPWGRWASLPCGTTEEPPMLSAEEFTARAIIWNEITNTATVTEIN